MGWQAEVVGVDRVVLFRLATSERFERATEALPGGERAAWRAASCYVAGRSRTEALGTATGLLERGHAVSVDVFGELLGDPDTAARVVEEYLSLAAALAPPPADAWLSVDLTHLALDADPAGTAGMSLATVLRLHVPYATLGSGNRCTSRLVEHATRLGRQDDGVVPLTVLRCRVRSSASRARSLVFDSSQLGHPRV